MFSHVAHHQQHHFPQSSYSFHHDTFKDLSQCSFENLAPGGLVSPELNASFRQRTERPQQYARPLRSTAALPQQLPTQTPFTSTSEFSEHMLRRKTPNGTLAAGYDGSPVEWTKRPHAMKHYLMPSITTSFSTGYAHAPTAGLEGQTPCDQDKSLESRVGDQLRIQSHHDEVPRGLYGPTSLMDEIKVDHSRRSSAAPPTGLDSVLNQSAGYHYSHKAAATQHVPTVLQPMWPPFVGATAIQRAGPCGPYWPNGAFEPYRPAPLQDPRYQGQIPDCANYSAQLQPAVSHYGQWLQAHSDCQSPSLVDSSHTSASLLEHERGLSSSPNKTHDTPSRARSASTTHTKAMPRMRSGEPLAYRSKPYSGKGPGLKMFYPTYQNSNVYTADFLMNPCEDSAFTSGNTQFKEKILVWAHRIYNNLLAYLEQGRLNPAQGQHGGGSHLPSSFYPRPPRRPYPSWANGYSSETLPSFDSKARVQAPLKVGNKVFKRSPTLLGSHAPSPGSNQALLPHPSSAQSSVPADNRSRYRWQSCDEKLGSLHNAPQPSYVPPQLTSDLHPNTPPAAAMYALEMLSRLCQESGFEWTDGTLLAGCLAYGLGDYNKAMKWYLKVLQRDPNNVEAMSNLAATLHALNRKKEAEHYWFHSVKLRPSYFEAVEHLIGLLHEGHRGREAVKVIEHVEQALRTRPNIQSQEFDVAGASHGLLSSGKNMTAGTDRMYTCDFGSSGYTIPPSDNGRMLALIHGKGNMLYQIGDNAGAAQAFEDAILIGAGSRQIGIRGLIRDILNVFSDQMHLGAADSRGTYGSEEPILLAPDVALETSRLVFPPEGRLPGLIGVPDGFGLKAAVSIVSNSLLSLAKIYQDGMSSSGAAATGPRATSGTQEILALYYLSLSLQPSPSTANNVGILLASVQHSARSKAAMKLKSFQPSMIPGVTAGSGIALALAYYDYGLKLDTRHAHLYTNLGSLFKDIGQLQAAIKMYEKAVECDGNFDIALANLANAVKDQGKVSDAIAYYKRAVISNPDFAEAVCGLANALNSVCNWTGRGGICRSGSGQDRWHVDERGDLYDSKKSIVQNRGWIEQVVAIVEKQLREGEGWGKGVLHSAGVEHLLQQGGLASLRGNDTESDRQFLRDGFEAWAGNQWEGAKVVRFIERATKNLIRQIYLHLYVKRTPVPSSYLVRPQLPAALAIPGAPTVLPFHTFTCPLSASQIRKISQRNGLRVSCSTLRAPWLSGQLYKPPAPPDPHLNIGYVSSDFNNHPLAHLMQSVFGFHDPSRAKAFCYATTVSDGSIHRQQIEREAPVFHDAASWSIDRLVHQIVDDGIHVLVNLNGYTRGAKNEVFAARPAPIQMSFMGFAGTLGAEWCDYLLADKIAVPPQTLRPWRRNVDLKDQVKDGNNDDDQEEWVYGENIVFTRDTFFCCDHRQSAPDSHEVQMDWDQEQRRRWRMRKELFPNLSDDTVILGNFNQLYKVWRS